MVAPYAPPFAITPAIVSLIAERVGQYAQAGESAAALRLRRINLTGTSPMRCWSAGSRACWTRRARVEGLVPGEGRLVETLKGLRAGAMGAMGWA